MPGTGKALRHDAERRGVDYEVERRNQEKGERGGAGHGDAGQKLAFLDQAGSVGVEEGG